jgi:hypothetical protein
LRPNVLESGLWSVQALLGKEQPTFLGRLRDEVRRRHTALWGQYVRQLNSELLDRAPELYTRLVLDAPPQRRVHTTAALTMVLASSTLAAARCPGSTRRRLLIPCKRS